MSALDRPSAEDARRFVETDFGLRIGSVVEVDGGADPAAAVWRMVDVAGVAWAVKWTTRRTTTGARVLGSMDVAAMDGAPDSLRTLHGRLRSRRLGGRLTVVRWLDGSDAATVGLDLAGWAAYGSLLAGVHALGALPRERRRGARRGIRRRQRRYRAAVRELDALAEVRPDDEVLDAWRSARPRIALLEQGTRLAVDPARDTVPCHGDPHLGNVLVSTDGRLRLIDWDEAVVAPRELDLHLVEFSVLFRPTSDHELAAFREGYGPADLDEARLVRYASIRALEDLTATGLAALHGPEETRDEDLRVFRGVLSPVGSASLVEPRLRERLEPRLRERLEQQADHTVTRSD